MKNPLPARFLRRLLLVPVALIGVGSILATSQVEDPLSLPRVAVSGNTAAMAQVSQDDVSVMDYNGGWGTELPLGYGFLADIDMDGAGGAMAVWTYHDSANAVRLDPAAGWQAATVLSNPSGTLNYTDPDVDLNPATGDGMAVWRRDAAAGPARTDIWAADYTGGAWGAQTLVETDDTAHMFAPRVAVDAAGNAVAVWHRSADLANYSPATVWAGYYDATGGTWGTPVQLSPATGESALYPQVGVDDAGNFFVLWVQGWDIYTAILPAGAGTWNAEQIINTAYTNVSTLYPRLAVDAGGDAFGVWVQGNTLYASRYDSSLPIPAWKPPVILNGVDTSAIQPRVATDGAGNAALVWVRSPGSEIVVSQYGAGAWDAGTVLGTGSNPDVALSATLGLAAWSDSAGAVQTSVW